MKRGRFQYAGKGRVHGTHSIRLMIPGPPCPRHFELLFDVEFKLYERLTAGRNEVFGLVEDPKLVAAAVAAVSMNHKRHLLMSAIKARHR